MDLIEIIDLKWMLAGEGIRIHVERVQNDPVYAAACLGQAARSTNPALRRLAVRLSDRISSAQRVD